MGREMKILQGQLLLDSLGQPGQMLSPLLLLLLDDGVVLFGEPKSKEQTSQSSQFINKEGLAHFLTLASLINSSRMVFFWSLRFTRLL